MVSGRLIGDGFLELTSSGFRLMRA